MESARVCVIDSSPTIRETIAIVLGGDHAVWCLTPDEFLRDPSKGNDADLLIVADDALPIEAVKLLPTGRPVLWLQSRASTPFAATGRTAIPRWFSPEILRSRVHALLTDIPATQQPSVDNWSTLDYPILSKDAIQLARRAVATHLPVLICGEPGTGKVRLARAIHAAGQNGRLVQLSPSSCNRAALQQTGGISAGHLTLLVLDIAGVATDGQQLLLELLDCGGFASEAGWHPVRLICGTSHSFSELARVQSLDRDLFYKLSVLPLTLPPLRDRVSDIPLLVTHTAADITRALATPPVTFTKRAMERLTHYLWFGNLAELETVLTRTVALAPTRSIDADDLLFGYGKIAPRHADAQGTNRAEVMEPAGGETVDLIINELAHEFKNPMVTIKTVAQHMERLLADEEGRQDVARLTGEAVDRMDRVLENLLQFTRFRTPHRHDVPLNELLAPCLSTLAPQLSERRVTLDYRPPDARSAFVDAAQIEYALDNLLRVIARDLQEGQTLSIHPLDQTTALSFTYRTMGPSFAGKLAALLDESGSGNDAPPLGLVLARSLIERNGGRVDARSAADVASVTVWLPSREEKGAGTGNGKATSLSS